jgi:serine/threonine protein phosphatase PrpC
MLYLPKVTNMANLRSITDKIFEILRGDNRNYNHKQGESASPASETTQPVDQVIQEKTGNNQKMTSAGSFPEMHLEPSQLIAGCGHSIGRQRDHNEDALFSLTTTIISDTTVIPFGLYIVADGMGGHKYGEVASAIAIRAMSNHILRKIFLPLLNQPPAVPQQSIQEIMQEGVQAAHHAIVRETPGGGTTLTAVLILGDQMTIAHVGDSRAYTISPDGRIEVLTRDHSLVKRLEELGQITAEEAAIHPQRNVLYRAVGQGEPFDAELITLPLPKSGYLLLCSDGLWGMVSDQEVYSIISTTPYPALASQKLVEAANTAGGTDNITALLVRLMA